MKQQYQRNVYSSAKLRAAALAAVLCALIAMLWGCAAEGSAVPAKEAPVPRPDREAVPDEGRLLYNADDGSVRVSLSTNPSGYASVCADVPEGGFTRLICPDGQEFSYPFEAAAAEKPLTVSLAGGSGDYLMELYGRTPETERPALLWSGSFTSEEADPYTAFLLPNAFVSYEPDGSLASLADTFAASADTDLDYAGAVYDDLISRCSYDEYAASEATADYIPNPEAFAAKTDGIACDMAAYYAALLRLNGIPARLCRGYTGETVHFWVSAYLETAGEASGVIRSKGCEWVRIDPAIGCANEPSEVRNYVNDDANYTLLGSC